MPFALVFGYKSLKYYIVTNNDIINFNHSWVQEEDPLLIGKIKFIRENGKTRKGMMVRIDGK